MATNLRLRPETEEALRREAARCGRSQQQIIRDAIDRHLGISGEGVPRTELGTLLADGSVLPPRTEFVAPDERLHLPETRSEALLDREDRS